MPIAPSPGTVGFKTVLRSLATAFLEYYHSQSEARDAVQMNCFGELEKVAISRRAELSKRIDSVSKQALGDSRSTRIAKNCGAALCSSQHEISRR